MRTLLVNLTLVLLFLPALALAADGKNLVIEITDEAGLPIPHAVVRNPVEKSRHSVHRENGRWKAEALHIEGDRHVVFKPGTLLTFEVSAAGYANEFVQYVVHRRSNFIRVALTAGVDLFELDPADEPLVAFRRDRPRDPR
jgi:hypothetical protein